MPIEKKTRKYEGKAYTFSTGMDELTGSMPTVIEHAELSDRKQPKRNVVRFIGFYFDVNGEPVGIATDYEEQQIDNAGGIIGSYTKPMHHKTAPLEVKQIMKKLLPDFQGMIYNGAVRGGKTEGDGFLGQNHNPAFDATGAWIVPTPESESAVRTLDYHAYENAPTDPSV